MHYYLSWFIFLVSALCVFRLALMLSSEAGPAAIFAKMRRAVPPKTNPGKGIRCFLCWSVWVAAGVTAWLYYFGQVVEVWMTPIYWLGLSGAAIVIKWMEK